MTAAEVVGRFRDELAADPDLEALLLMADPLLNQHPAAVVATLDALAASYCRARMAFLELPEVTP